MKNKITIAGAGLAGSLLSVYLAKKGFEVNVYERRPDMRKENAGAGKSINLALSTRGIHALKEVGLYDEIKKISIPMYGRMIHAQDGQLMFQRYGKDDTEYINAVSRAELNNSLMNLAEKNDNVKIFFNERCTGADFKNAEIFLHNEKTGVESGVKSEVVIATDGATSALRMEMQKMPRFNFSQVYENYGYKELTIPPGPDGSFLMEKNSLHIWPRGSFMLIALPNLDGSYTCTLFIAYDMKLAGENSLEYIDSKDKAQKFFAEMFPDALELMPDVADQYMSNPTGTLMTVKCHPWIAEDKVALLGDACHAIVPFFGQGMNAGFEDCIVLNDLITKNNENWSLILPQFEELRKPDADAIADLALNNFIEMRDKVADAQFLLQKKIEGKFSVKHPDKWIPAYSMVTFCPQIRYSEALEKGSKQQTIMDEIMALPNIENIWDSIEIENLILSKLS